MYKTRRPFTTIAEMIMRVTLRVCKGECRIGGLTINNYNLRYADDVGFLAQEFQERVSKIEQASAKYGDQINVKK